VANTNVKTTGLLPPIAPKAFGGAIGMDLSHLSDKLNSDYYSVIEKLCVGAGNNLSLLQQLEVQPSAASYIERCNALIDEIKNFINARKGYYSPYLYELHRKEDASHDCSSCSGNCHAGHNIKLAEIKESIARIKDLPNRLQMMSLPLHSETLYPDVYRALRNHLALLQDMLTELLFVEETYLIPKVAEAQKNINARS